MAPGCLRGAVAWLARLGAGAGRCEAAGPSEEACAGPAQGEVPFAAPGCEAIESGSSTLADSDGESETTFELMVEFDDPVSDETTLSVDGMARPDVAGSVRQLCFDDFEKVQKATAERRRAELLTSFARLAAVSPSGRDLQGDPATFCQMAEQFINDEQGINATSLAREVLKLGRRGVLTCLVKYHPDKISVAGQPLRLEVAKLLTARLRQTS